jgi:hypothetical protein
MVVIHHHHTLIDEKWRELLSHQRDSAVISAERHGVILR